jgi:hypothetical protein
LHHFISASRSIDAGRPDARSGRAVSVRIIERVAEDDEIERDEGVGRRDFLRGMGKRGLGRAVSGRGLFGWAIDRAQASAERTDDDEEFDEDWKERPPPPDDAA